MKSDRLGTVPSGLGRARRRPRDGRRLRGAGVRAVHVRRAAAGRARRHARLQPGRRAARHGQRGRLPPRHGDRRHAVQADHAGVADPHRPVPVHRRAAAGLRRRERAGARRGAGPDGPRRGGDLDPVATGRRLGAAAGTDGGWPPAWSGWASASASCSPASCPTPCATARATRRGATSTASRASSAPSSWSPRSPSSATASRAGGRGRRRRPPAGTATAGPPPGRRRRLRLAAPGRRLDPAHARLRRVRVHVPARVRLPRRPPRGRQRVQRRSGLGDVLARRAGRRLRGDPARAAVGPPRTADVDGRRVRRLRRVDARRPPRSPAAGAARGDRHRAGVLRAAGGDRRLRRGRHRRRDLRAGLQRGDAGLRRLPDGRAPGRRPAGRLARLVHRRLPPQRRRGHDGRRRVVPAPRPPPPGAADAPSRCRSARANMGGSTIRGISMQLASDAGRTDIPLLDETIGANLARTVAAHGDVEALVARHQGVRWTYAELGERVARCAKGLLGARAGGRRPGRAVEPQLRRVDAAAVRHGRDRRRPRQPQPGLPHPRAGVRAEPVVVPDAVRRAVVQDVGLRRHGRAGRPDVPGLERAVFFWDDDWDEIVAGAGGVADAELDARRAGAATRRRRSTSSTRRARPGSPRAPR